MPIEQFKNDPQTTLNGGIDGVTVTVTVTDSSDFPATGQFRIKIGGELMLVTAVGGAVFTVVRGIEGTSQSAHADLDPVYHVLTAGALENLSAGQVQSGLYSGRPAAGQAGRLYLPTDGRFVDRDTGSSWESWGPLNRMYRPALADFTWVNQGAATAVEEGGGLLVTAPALAGANNRLLVRAIPAAPFTVTVCLHANMWGQTYPHCGLVLRDSVLGRHVDWRIQWFGSYCSFLAGKWLSPTSLSADYSMSSHPLGAMLQAPVWLRISDDGTGTATARKFQVSWDGLTFVTLHSTSRTDFITPDQIGLHVHSNQANVALAARFMSYSEG